MEDTLTKEEMLELLRDTYIEVISSEDLVSSKESAYFFETI